MNKWTRDISSCSRMEVIQFCVNDDEWQEFRLSLKGITTSAKLELLGAWLVDHKFTRRAEVQVDNYLGALKRGGQISATGEILK